MERHLFSPGILNLMGAASDHHATFGDPFAGGDLFKVYSRRLFRRSDFDELHATVGRGDSDADGAESTWTPDFQFLHKRSGHIFWVECQFRSDYYLDKVDWYRKDSLERYKRFQEKVKPQKVFFITGFGGRPMKPSYMFCMTLDEMVSNGTNPDILERHERDPARPFDFKGGRIV
jgi:hypothetical protein